MPTFWNSGMVIGTMTVVAMAHASSYDGPAHKMMNCRPYNQQSRVGRAGICLYPAEGSEKGRAGKPLFCLAGKIRVQRIALPEIQA